MTFQPRLRDIEAREKDAGARRLRLAALGDGLVGPISVARRGASGPERFFRDDRFMVWLRTLLPGLDAPESALLGAPGETSVMIARRAEAAIDSGERFDAVLICAGLQDCFAAIRGVAPPPDEMVRAFETMASAFLARDVKPIFLIPPPNPMFSNGLFADRYIAIVATLRRLCRDGAGPVLIDPISSLVKPRANGVTPDPRYVANDNLNRFGAFRLAQTVAERLRELFPDAKLDEGSDAPESAALNANPRLLGAGGAIEGDVAGVCVAGSRLDGSGLGGARIEAALAPRGGQRLVFSGRYSTGWGFVRLHQRVPAHALEALAGGDVIEALCDIDLAAPVENIASVSLHATAVWDRDFIGLHSSLYGGGPGMAEAYAGRLRTPRFALPRRLDALHVSLQIHLAPGADLAARGEIAVRSLAVRKAEAPARDGVGLEIMQSAEKAA